MLFMCSNIDRSCLPADVSCWLLLFVLTAVEKKSHKINYSRMNNLSVLHELVLPWLCCLFFNINYFDSKKTEKQHQKR